MPRRSTSVLSAAKLFLIISISIGSPWTVSSKIVSRSALDFKPSFTKKQIPILKEHKKTENFVKNLEYQTYGQDNNLNTVVVPINLNLLSDTRLAEDVDEGLGEEFDIIDKELGDPPVTEAPKNGSSLARNHRQMSLMYQGVYTPDSRFNAFVDGVMVNMVVEMRRKKMDPLYFRVYDRGVIEHVPTRSGRKRDNNTESTVSSTLVSASSTTEAPSSTSGNSPSSRKGKQRNRGTAIGGGVVRGLTKVKRFGNAEVQIAGNTTLVRSHYIFGPLNIELVFETAKGVKTINSTLSALAAHTLTEVFPNNSSRHMEFIIDSPVDYQIDLVGAKNRRYRSLSLSAILRLYKREGKMEKRLKQCISKAHEKPIPDVTKNDGITKRKGRKLSKNSRAERRSERRRSRSRNEKLNGRNRSGKQKGVDLEMDELGASPDRIVREDSIGTSFNIRGE